MTTSIDPSRVRDDAAPDTGRTRTPYPARIALAGVAAVLILGTLQVGGQLAVLTGVVTALALIAAAVIGWERVVTSAQTAGLVSRRS
ncbi:hypothetical protein E4P42_01930 [Mycobacterium sp. PS03-16]|uniref:hypothetical protein n=1 Tax=Mycobacterium sp. PS03-16 TaxID=2559611 RepID=UPI0010749571|nr:hypothetical protein [Mycobacterium sp. PS03-16]TFV60971.1 hypothetical protein E4P42_01930 [Mycobacterium sp. PS03-16]